MGWILVILGCIFIAKKAFVDGRNDYKQELQMKQAEEESFREKVMNIVNGNK